MGNRWSRRGWLVLVTVFCVLAPLADARAADPPRKGGAIVIGRPTEHETLDPHKSVRHITSHVVYMVYDTLVAVAPDMKTVTPLLAKSWEVSPDSRTYVFHLRPDVTFHSGDRFTADAVKFTLERWANPATKSPTRNFISALESVDVVNPQTVRVTLKTPRADFLANLGIAWASMLNPRAVAKLGQDYGSTGMDGTGPFKFGEWRRADRLVLERHEAYRWGPTFYANKGPAHVERVVWRKIPEDATRILELESGGINMAYNPPFPELDRLKKNPAVAVVDYAYGFTVPMLFNLKNPILADVKVRRAIAHAINRDELVQNVYYGYARRAWGPLADNFPEFAPAVRELEYAYNPARAGALLDEAGWRMAAGGVRMKDGKPLKLTQYLGIGSGFPEIFTIVQARLREVGIDLELKTLEWSALFGRFGAGEHDIATLWMIYLTPQHLFEQYYHSSSIPLLNSAFYSNPELDALIARAAGIADPGRRKAVFAEMTKVVMRDVPILPLTWFRDVIGRSAKVRDFAPVPTYGAGFYKLMDAWVDSR
jgi:peptide/nickel transport system substrate-binding protein